MIDRILRPAMAGLVTLSLATALACGGAEDAPQEETTVEDDVPAVADSVIVREVLDRLEADPRLDVEGVSVDATSTDQTVVLRGEVPTPYEASIAQEIARSVLGVRRVIVDSLNIASRSRT